MNMVTLFLIALLPRLILANQSFWLDEASTFSQAALPISQFFQAMKADIHPPLSFLILNFWIPLVGKTEWLLRLPGIIFGSLTIPALYLFFNELFPKKLKVGLIAAFLLAINPLHIYYSQELRMYSLNAFLTVLSWLLLFKWFKGKNSKVFSVGYLLVSTANLYTFYGSVFNLVAQWVFVFWQFPKKVKPFALSNLLLAVFFLPWLPTFTSQLQAGSYLTKVLPGWSAVSGVLSAKSIGLIFAKFTLGRISFADKIFYTLFVISVVLYFVLALVLSYLKFKPKLLITWMLVPLAVGILMSLKTPVLGYWRFLFILPAFIGIIVLGLTSLPGKTPLLNLSAIVLIFIFSNLIYWTSPSFQRENWRDAGRLINQPNSITILNFPDIFAPLKFYAPDAFYYPNQERLGIMRKDLDQTLPPLLQSKDKVFVFDYLSDLTDPKRQIITWLKQAGLKQVETHNLNGVGFVYEFTSP